MDNQHRKIEGYSELGQVEIDLMNAVKDVGASLGPLVEELRKDSSLDQRWVSIGATDLQKGIMALVRAVAKPTSF